MKIFGIGIGTIVLILATIYIVRKWGNSIPLVDKIG